MAGVPGRNGANVPEPVEWVLLHRKESVTHQGERHFSSICITRYRYINQRLRSENDVEEFLTKPRIKYVQLTRHDTLKVTLLRAF